VDVPKRVLTVSKAEAASRQIDEAIRALQRGDFDVAVTLAGAAEGMFDRPDTHHHLWSYMHARAAECADQLFDGDDARKNKRELSDFLNAARTWLKHPVPEQGEHLTLDRSAAVLMIERAMSKLAPPWSPLMNDFKAWLVENVDEVFEG
jgi:hypothetical protein